MNTLKTGENKMTIYSIECYQENPHAKKLMRMGNSSRASPVVKPMRWKEHARFECLEKYAIEAVNAWDGHRRLIETYTGKVILTLSQ